MQQGLRLLLALAALLCAGITAGATAELVVTGQSLPLTGAGFPVANRVLAGARAQVERVNVSGGILGRPLELVTLDDGGDPQRVSANLRTLACRYGAVAIVNCLSERSCLQAAQVTRELRIPLMGPISGALPLRAPDINDVFSTRPDDAREADDLTHQLHALGITKTVVLTDDSEPVRTMTLMIALQRTGQRVSRTLTEVRAESLAVAFRDIAKSAPQTLVLSLGYEALESLGALDLGGFRLAFGCDRHHGSDYVEIGMRARVGRLLR